MKEQKIKKVAKKSIPLQVSPVTVSGPRKKASNGQTDKLLGDTNSRSFETKLIPRYNLMPPLPSGLPEPQFSQAAEKILKERYLLKGNNLEASETIAERFWHTAYDIASSGFDFRESRKEVLEKARQFYLAMITQQFLPNSPTLMNAGKQNTLQYSACFVLPVEDDLGKIFDSIRGTALIHQSGGGTGFSFSRLRQKGSIVETTGGTASGPVSFMRVFNESTDVIKQGGTRRGANMGILRVDHPDILEFIRCKGELDETNQSIFEEIAPFLPSDEARTRFKMLLLDSQMTNFNISVAMTDEFMKAYERGENYNLVAPHTGEITGQLSSREVFEEIVERAWSNGEPGLIFIDRINHSPANPLPALETIEATNPCGEQPLAPWDACNLGSINLGKFVKEDEKKVDWEALGKLVHLAVEFLDDVVQVSPFNLEPIYKKVHENRRIGLGVMGWADMLFKLKIPYNSNEALKLAEEVMSFVSREGHLASENLARERRAFPNFPFSIYADGNPVRNAAITTIAPTGTISIIADCSSGIEPVFALAYLHKAKAVGNEVRTLTIANQTFEEIGRKLGFYSDNLAEKVTERGSVLGLEEVPEDWQKVFVTASEIEPEWHVKMQAAFQKYTDNAVSKTINLPHSATVEDVRCAYLLAWETGCKGITIYRDGSKSVQVLNVVSALKPEEKPLVAQDTLGSRPMILRGRTYKINTPVGEAFITVNRDEIDQPFEVFITIGKAGMHTAADAEALGRMISLSLRVSRPNSKLIAQKIVSQLKGIGGYSQVGFGKDRVMSLADAAAKALAEELSHLQTQIQAEKEAEAIPLGLTVSSEDSSESEGESLPTTLTLVDLCPECGQVSLVFEEGCKKCHNCGFSMC